MGVTRPCSPHCSECCLTLRSGSMMPWHGEHHGADALWSLVSGHNFQKISITPSQLLLWHHGATKRMLHANISREILTIDTKRWWVYKTPNPSLFLRTTDFTLFPSFLLQYKVEYVLLYQEIRIWSSRKERLRWSNSSGGWFASCQ